MNISEPFIKRPVGTTLLSIAVALAGIIAYFLLPVSPLPQVDFPTISVSAGLPGADPVTMASSVATPLERQFGRIAGITEMTSSSTLGSTTINLVFDLDRNIDAAARDVQAAINAAAGQLPANLPSLPSYRKVNPADAPILILALRSTTYSRARLYDAATSILQQKLSQVDGVGQVSVWGGANPAVRVEVNPTSLNGRGLSLADVRTALQAANANNPKGTISGDRRTYSLETTDQLFSPDDYERLIISYNNGAAVRVGDVATVVQSIENIRNSALINGSPGVLIPIFRQPGANIINTTDLVKAELPRLRASIPASMQLDVVIDRTITIRASVHDIEVTLLLSVLLVVLVVFVFLRSWRSTLIPSVAVPLSLLGTAGVMYLVGYSLDNLSLMALAIATGFVVDDAIVVVENVTRHLEAGMKPMAAALLGAREIGFTVMSISISLVAVFIPLLLMGGIVGRLFREFAVTLSVAIGVSMVISLTMTPMMCAVLLRPHSEERHGPIYRFSESLFDLALKVYELMLRWVMRHSALMLCATAATVGLTIFLFIIIPKGFFPIQDVGRLSGQVKTDQDISYQALVKLQAQYAKAVAEDPATENVLAFAGTNGVRFFMSLKPMSERKVTMDQLMDRLRKKLGGIPGANLILVPQQDLQIGGRSSAAMYQYTLQGDDLKLLHTWAGTMVEAIRKLPGFADVQSDEQDHGLSAFLTIDRASAARLGVQTTDIDNALYDAFGQRQVSTMYTALNQYHVVMEVEPQFYQNADGLRHVYVKSASGAMVPLSAVTKYEPSTTALAVNHQGLAPAITISFNLTGGRSLGDAVVDIQDAARAAGMPATIHGTFAGTAQAFQASLTTLPLLFAAAFAAVYIILGMLYESLIHPITILSTLPSAFVGALLALMLWGTPFSMIAMIGCLLLIGIVKKNAIMMIDFALEAERKNNLSPEEAIFQACILRFRPIMMTTMAALLGGLPLAIGGGTGSELRQPLGITIVGGLIFSQALTLFTTPVIYLYMDWIRLWLASFRHGGSLMTSEAAQA